MLSSDHALSSHGIVFQKKRGIDRGPLMKIISFHLQYFPKAKISKIMASSGQKRALVHALISNLATRQPLIPQILEYFISATCPSPKAFQQLADTIRQHPLTPHSTIKVLMLIHAYLQSGRNIIQDEVIAFINYLLFLCSNFNQNSSLQRPKDTSCGKGRIHTDMSTRQDESCESKEGLIFSMAKIYIRYLLKIVSIYDQYRRLDKMKDPESHLVWMMINLLKNIASFTTSFTIIGRYFIKQYGGLAVSMIEVLNGDIRKLNESIKGHIVHQNHLLSCVTSPASRTQIVEFMKMMDQINSLNETLIQIYLGKYFYDDLQHLQLPLWINTNSHEFDAIFKIAGKHKAEGGQQGQGRLKERLVRCKTRKRIRWNV